MLSKGHAAPILYAAWAEAGAFDRAELMKLRRIDSDLEGHPTPRLPFVDVATGSLGQGICAAIGSALNARRIKSDYRTYVLLGDGESAEGSVWEAADVGAMDGLDSICGITDVNALGQSGPTMWQHDMEAFARRWRAFGWHAIVIDGHDLDAILDAYAEARRTKGQPTMILARTIKGKGVSFVEGKEGWHGRAFKKGEELDRALAELEKQFVPAPPGVNLAQQIQKPAARPRPVDSARPVAPPAYKMGEEVATREAYGVALAKLGEADPRVVALDADVKNSTFSDKFEKAFPDRFYENFIAEQVMIGAAMGLAARGAIPFPSTFACFLSRAADFIRMAAISNVGIKMAGSHAGVSIGEDGPSQMALEDLAMCRAEPNITVLYPCDAVSAERLVALAAYHPGAGLHPHEPAENAGHLLERRAVHRRRAQGAAGERTGRRDGRGCRRDGLRGPQGLRPAEGGGHVDSRDRSVFAAADRSRRSRRRRAGDRRPSDHRRGSLCGRRHWRRGRRSRVRRRVRRAPSGRARDSPQRQARRAARSLRHLGEPHRRSRPRDAPVLLGLASRRRRLESTFPGPRRPRRSLIQDIDYSATSNDVTGRRINLEALPLTASSGHTGFAAAT